MDATTEAQPVAIEVRIGRIETPWGTFGAALSPAGLGRLTFPGESLATCAAWARRWWPAAGLATDRNDGETAAATPLAALSEQLSAYLAGARRAFDLPLDLRGTPFQLRVWQALRAIPYGQVCSYGDLAAVLGQPAAVRAVGLANGANPVPIVVPCHRVIGKDGSLTGYGGGLSLKERLLRLEGTRFTPPSRPSTGVPFQAALDLR